MMQGSHYSDSIKFQAFSMYGSKYKLQFSSLNSDILCKDIVLDFYPDKIPIKCEKFGIVRHFEDSRF